MYAIGNLYQHIGIVGNNKIGKKLYNYLNSLPLVQVYQLTENDFKTEDYKKKYISRNKIELIITCDLKNIYYTNIYCLDFFYFLIKAVSKNLRSTNTQSMYYDLQQNIIPKLKTNNIEIIFLTFPIIEQYKNKVNFKTQNCLNLGDARDWENFLGSKERVQDFKNITYGDQYGFMNALEYNSDYVHYNNLIRTTIGNHENQKNNIIMFGPCIIFGCYASDNETISSYLQKEIPNYNIINRGCMLNNFNWTMRSSQYCTGDKVIIMVEENLYHFSSSDKVINIMDAYNQITDIENFVWDDLLHCNKKVNQVIATTIYEYLKENQLLLDSHIDKKQKFTFTNIPEDSIPPEIEESINKWIESNNIKKLDLDGVIGSIVMNCNPFTIGHKYLIEQAAKQVDTLLIFVVEEDQSYFPFSDRINWVKSCTSGLKNVVVTPSGQYIISLLTMPGYFEKDELQNQKVDLSSDIKIFALGIAPKLKISVRFAGEEPYDLFTKQYNETMKILLPKYGIEFIEIERKRMEGINGLIISASTVRNYLKENNFKELKSLVPEVVYQSLIQQTSLK